MIVSSFVWCVRGLFVIVLEMCMKSEQRASKRSGIHPPLAGSNAIPICCFVKDGLESVGQVP